MLTEQRVLQIQAILSLPPDLTFLTTLPTGKIVEKPSQGYFHQLLGFSKPLFLTEIFLLSN